MYRITLIPGDGTGPEITEAVVRVLEATGVSFEWDVQNAGEDVYKEEGSPLPDRVLESIKKNKVAIKGTDHNSGRQRLQECKCYAASGA